MTYTKFFDMCSGGSRKTEYGVVYIEANEEVAKQVFEARFARDPENETCRCCGDDYSIYEVDGVDHDRFSLPILVIDRRGHETVFREASRRKVKR